MQDPDYGFIAKLYLPDDSLTWEVGEPEAKIELWFRKSITTTFDELVTLPVNPDHFWIQPIAGATMREFGSDTLYNTFARVFHLLRNNTWEQGGMKRQLSHGDMIVAIGKSQFGAVLIRSNLCPMPWEWCARMICMDHWLRLIYLGRVQ